VVVPGVLPEVEDAERVLLGCDAVVHLSPALPVGLRARWQGSWRAADLSWSEGVRRLAAAARGAGVRRFVHQSVSYLYADGGPDWIDEDSALGVTRATEPVSVGELVVQEFASPCRTGVVLRTGLLVGDSDLTRWSLRCTAQGRAVGLGDPDGFAHLLHSDDLGGALVAALDAPTGTYNVGAEPVLRRAFVDACAAAAAFLGRWSSAGPRLEPLARSLRVSSSRFSQVTGWVPRRVRVSAGWFAAAAAEEARVR
jgi:nucleoside-diphosphate-sugar epimerase